MPKLVTRKAEVGWTLVGSRNLNSFRAQGLPSFLKKVASILHQSVAKSNKREVTKIFEGRGHADLPGALSARSVQNCLLFFLFVEAFLGSYLWCVLQKLLVSSVSKHRLRLVNWLEKRLF